MRKSLTKGRKGAKIGGLFLRFYLTFLLGVLIDPGMLRAWLGEPGSERRRLFGAGEVTSYGYHVKSGYHKRLPPKMAMNLIKPMYKPGIKNEG